MHEWGRGQVAYFGRPLEANKIKRLEKVSNPFYKILFMTDWAHLTCLGQ